MNVDEYINSGIIEDYCLRFLSQEEMDYLEHNALLYPEIKIEIELSQNALVAYAEEFVTGAFEHKQKILDILDNLKDEENITLESLPLLNKYSDHQKWLHFIKPLLPAKLDEPSLIHQLRGKDGIYQSVFWTNDDMPYEIHKSVHETLLLLEGRCRCRIEGEVHELNPGDLLSVPLFKSHNLEIIDGPVLVVVQRIKAA